MIISVTITVSMHFAVFSETNQRSVGVVLRALADIVDVHIRIAERGGKVAL